MAASGQTKFLSAKPTCALLFAVWIYAFWPTIHMTIQTYLKSSFDYHGLLVIPLILLFISKSNSTLNRAALIYNQYGLVLLLSSSLVWLFAAISELELLSQIAMISMLISIVLTICGKKITHIILLPLLCLYLLLPIGASIFTITTQWFTTLLVKALSASNISVYWEAHQIYVNNHAYDILAYLNSFKYIMLFITMGCSFALLRTKNISTFLVIISSFVIMPFITLLLTLYSFILLNNIWQSINISQNSVILIGWICTILGILNAIILSIIVGQKSYLIHSSEDIDWHAGHVNKRFNWLLPLAMASIIILITPIVEKQLHISKHYSSTEHLLAQENELPDWNGPKVQYSFTNEELRIEKKWIQIKQAAKKIKINNKTIKFQETILRSQNKQYKIVWNINYINGHLINNTSLAKALSKIYTLTPKGSRSGVITISTQVKNELNTGRNTLKEYMQKMSTDNNLKWLK